MINNTLNDAGILLYNFDYAYRKANKREREEIQIYIDALNCSPENREVVEMCAKFYSEIHYIISDKRQLELPFMNDLYEK